MQICKFIHFHAYPCIRHSVVIQLSLIVHIVQKIFKITSAIPSPHDKTYGEGVFVLQRLMRHFFTIGSWDALRRMPNRFLQNPYGNATQLLKKFPWACHLLLKVSYSFSPRSCPWGDGMTFIFSGAPAGCHTLISQSDLKEIAKWSPKMISESFRNDCKLISQHGPHMIPSWFPKWYQTDLKIVSPNGHRLTSKHAIV